jgi:hypothetical protein
MELGFFISIRRRTKKGSAVATWFAVPVESPRGWDSTETDTIESAIIQQRNVYFDRCTRNEPLPALVRSMDMPMASGKITRFVSIKNDDIYSTN